MRLIHFRLRRSNASPPAPAPPPPQRARRSWRRMHRSRENSSRVSVPEMENCTCSPGLFVVNILRWALGDEIGGGGTARKGEKVFSSGKYVEKSRRGRAKNGGGREPPANIKPIINRARNNWLWGVLVGLLRLRDGGEKGWDGATGGRLTNDRSTVAPSSSGLRIHSADCRNKIIRARYLPPFVPSLIPQIFEMRRRGWDGLCNSLNCVTSSRSARDGGLPWAVRFMRVTRYCMEKIYWLQFILFNTGSSEVAGLSLIEFPFDLGNKIMQRGSRRR